jgi:tRNA-specific 2-thiouridylase
VDTARNTVVVGPSQLLTVDRIAGERAVWFEQPTPMMDHVVIQIRAHAEPVPARIIVTPDGVTAELTGAPLRGIAAGQSLVIYRDTQVLGQATITRAWRSAAPRESAGQRTPVASAAPAVSA